MPCSASAWPPGPLAGGLLTAAAGWRRIFWVNIPVAAAAIVLAGLFVPESKSARARRPDPAGQVLVIVILGSLAWAIMAYGLSAGIITRNMPLAMDMARWLRTGLIHVGPGGQPLDDEPMAAFGGTGDSGYGRFGGRAAIDAFTETRWVKQWYSRRDFPI